MEIDIKKLAAQTPYTKQQQKDIMQRFKFVQTRYDLENAAIRFGSQLKLNDLSINQVIEELLKALDEPKPTAKKTEVKADG